MPRPTPLTTLNGKRIYCAVLPQYTFRTDSRLTDRPTDGLGEKPVPRVLTLEINALKGCSYTNHGVT